MPGDDSQKWLEIRISSMATDVMSLRENFGTMQADNNSTKLQLALLTREVNALAQSVQDLSAAHRAGVEREKRFLVYVIMVLGSLLMIQVGPAAAPVLSAFKGFFGV